VERHGAEESGGYIGDRGGDGYDGGHAEEQEQEQGEGEDDEAFAVEDGANAMKEEKRGGGFGEHEEDAEGGSDGGAVCDWESSNSNTTYNECECGESGDVMGEQRNAEPSHLEDRHSAVKDNTKSHMKMVNTANKIWFSRT